MKKKFERRMAMKGHKGEVEFVHYDEQHETHSVQDRTSGEIQVYVISDAVARGLNTKSPKEFGLGVGSLSGGEKSTTSLILLAAIADAADPPFRVVDEFDVFQDEATRKASMKTLLDDATIRGADGLLRQHILLTPHDVSSAVPKSGGDVRVFSMPNPQR
jgi:hypothetical protein